MTAVRALPGQPGAAIYTLAGARLRCLGRVDIGTDVTARITSLLKESSPRSGEQPIVASGLVLAQAQCNGHPACVVAGHWPTGDVPRDAVPLIQAVARLWAAAHEDRDSLTGLAGRRVLTDHLQLASRSAARSRGVPALVFCDVDGLKRVNDRHGHNVGDRLLRAVAKRITDAVRPGDTVARVGGDEFVVLCPAVDGVVEASDIAARLYDVLAAPHQIEAAVLDAPVSIGVTVGPFSDPEEGIRQADRAMYTAKRERRGYATYDTQLEAADRWRLHVRTAIPAAVRTGQLRLLYQPQYRLSSGRMVVLEALLRWQHPDRGLLAPDQFLPVIESATDTSDALAEWVLTAACHQARTWEGFLPGRGLPRVAVNISPRQLAEGRLVPLVLKALEESDLPGQRLQVEITETSILADPVDARRQLLCLRDEGVSIALDDFGTGYGSLRLLHDLPVDVLKIDQSFIRNLPTDARAMSIVSSMIRLGYRLKTTVCAEGVETVQQLHALRRVGCHDVQGFLLQRPCAGDAVPGLPRYLPAGANIPAHA